MKKLLTTTLCLWLFYLLSAQNLTPEKIRLNQALRTDGQKTELGLQGSVAVPANIAEKHKAARVVAQKHQADLKAGSQTDVTETISPVDLFSSINVYTLLIPTQTCIVYNPDIQATMFTARGHTGVIGTGNDICTAVSTNGGVTFASGVSVNTTGGNNRYPSGAIYNPAGNTVSSNAKKVFTAPVTGGSGWSGNKYATTNWSNSGLYYQFIAANPSGDLLVRGGLDVASNGIAHTSGLEYSISYTSFQGYVFRGTYNSGLGGFEWTEQELTIPFYFNPGSGTYYIDSDWTNTAFSPNGLIGYTLFIGSDSRAASNDLTSYQPIVFKTTDAGQTWTLMDNLSPYLFNNPVISPYIYPLRDTWGSANEQHKPFFSETDIVVDNDGVLHIMALCKGAYSDHPDSLAYTYTFDRGAIFDICNPAGGNIWEARYIDTLETNEVKAEESGYGVGSDAVGWDHRLQASRSADGNVVFAIWTDTDSQFFGTEINLYPDVRGQAYRVSDGYASDVVDFTNQTYVYGENYFHFVAPVCRNNGSTYTIPVTKSDIRTTNDPGQPVYHSYLNGITFTLGPNQGVNASFVANPYQGIAPLQVQFTSTSTGNPTNYYWNFDDPTSGVANTSTLINPSHTFNNPGTYYVGLYVSNSTSSDSCFYEIVVTSGGGGTTLDPPLNLSGTASGINVHLVWEAPDTTSGGPLKLYQHDSNPANAYYQSYNMGYGTVYDLTNYPDATLHSIDFHHSSWGILGTWQYKIHVVDWDNFTEIAVLGPYTTTGNDLWENGIILDSLENLGGGLVGIILEPLSNNQADAYPSFSADNVGPEGVSVYGTLPDYSNFTSSGIGDFLQNLWIITSFGKKEQAVAAVVPCRESPIHNSKGATSSTVVHPPLTLHQSAATGNPLMPSSTLIGYKVYRNNSLLTPTPVSNLYYDDLAVPIGNHSYKVTAVYQEGESVAAGPITIVISELFCIFDPFPQFGEAPLLVGFTNYSTGNPTGYLWDFGDPASGALNSSTLESPMHLFENPGTYHVTLTITDGVNQSSWADDVFVSYPTNMPVEVVAGSGYKNCIPINWQFYGGKGMAPQSGINSCSSGENGNKSGASADYYNIYRSQTLNGTYTLKGTTMSYSNFTPSTVFTDYDVTPGTTYFYKISAMVYGTESDMSDPVSASCNTTGIETYAPASTNIPIIDGFLNLSEWSDANTIDLTNNSGVYNQAPASPVTCYIKRNGNYLYIGVSDEADTSMTTDELALYFDNNCNHIYDNGDGNLWFDADEYMNNQIEYREITGVYPYTLSFSPGMNFPSGVVGALGMNNGHRVYEIKIDLTQSPLIPVNDAFGIFLFTKDRPSEYYTGNFPNEAIWIDPNTYAKVLLTDPNPGTPITTAACIGLPENSTAAIPVTVDNFNNITAVSLRLDYDPTVLTFTGYDNLTTLLPGIIINNVPVNANLSKVMVSWSDITPVSMPDDSKLFDLMFNYTSGETTLIWNNTDNNGSDCEYADANGDPLPDSPTAMYYNNGCVTFQPGYLVSGILSYNNSTSTGLDNVGIMLYDGSAAYDSTTADQNGSYEFQAVENGTYQLYYTCFKPWTGVNATDAIKIQRHFTGLEPLQEPIRIDAADVNLTNSVNATDALKTKRRFTGIDNSFARGDWTFAFPVLGGNSITVNNSDVEQNVLGLCTGDVNGSGIPQPGKSMAGGIELIVSGLIEAGAGSELIVPIRATLNDRIGAISWIMNYPQEWLRVERVEAPYGENIWKADDGELRFAWSEVDPLHVTDGEPLFNIVFAVNDKLTENINVLLLVAGESEIANEQGEVQMSYPLSMPQVVLKKSIGINPTNSQMVSIFPNPANDKINIEFGMETPSQVEVRLFDATGREVLRQANGWSMENQNRIELSTAFITEGIYSVMVLINDKSEPILFRSKIIVQHP